MSIGCGDRTHGGESVTASPIASPRMSENHNRLDSRPQLDHESNPDFFEYYERESASEETLARFRRTREKLLGLAERNRIPIIGLQVLDIGCGAGTQCRLWAEDGHQVHGLDVNGPLIELARQRASQAGLPITFELGTATNLPFANASMNVCLLPELLEHVVDWHACVDEAVRVLKPDGLLYLSTTNRLCPIQQEFNLPGYSWYPAFIKHKIEHLAVTTHPGLVNHAKYPAVHWFTSEQLSAYLSTRGMECFDRFAMVDESTLTRIRKLALTIAKSTALTRFIGYVFTPVTTLFAIKRSGHQRGGAVAR